MRALFKFFSSLRLTVVLLGFSMVLVLLATFEQVQWGVFEVQKRYFEAFVTIWQYPEQWSGADSLHWLKIPLPGGFLLGGLLLINLACAHFRYFRASWKKSGIVLTHAGVALLIISGFLTAYLQEENFMWINVGGQSNYIESFHDMDLVFIDHADPRTDTVVSIPVSHLTPGETVSNAALPFSVKTVFYYPNSDIGSKGQYPNLAEIPADHGIATIRDLRVAQVRYSYANEAANLPSAVILLATPQGPLGNWLVSAWLDPQTMQQIYETVPPIYASHVPQTFTVNGHTWEVTLRPRREYLPYTLKLNKFVHDLYPGTMVPKNFESDVQLVNGANHEDRPVLIYMNHPLRYGGLTFYQQSFGAADQASKLQVVRNPGAPLPYIAVALVGVGMIIQFVLSLLAHLRREKANAGKTAAAATP